MGFSFGKALRIAGSAVKSVAKVPFIGSVPVIGNAISLAAGAATVYGGVKAAQGVFGGGSSPNLPALPGMPGGMSMIPPTSSIPPGDRSIFRNDPNLPAMLKAYAIPKAALKECYRAPRGFVVFRDEVGDPYGLPKAIARAVGMWKPAKKPLLSIRDTNAIRRAGSAIKKLQNAEKMAKKIANWKSPNRPATRNIIIEKKGK